MFSPCKERSLHHPRAAAGLGLLAVALVAVAQPVAAQSYPTKPVRMISPFPLGGLDASSEQGPAERGAGTRLRDATVKLATGASFVSPAPCASPGSDPRGSPLPPCDAPRLRDATVRESDAAAVLIAQASIPLAQYPNRPIRMISPFPPGGGTDAVARVIAQALSDQLGQQVVVDSRGGANGVIGTEIAAKSAADGYTLLLGNSATFAILPNLTQKLPYDPVRDFNPVSLGALSDFVLVVHPSVPAKNVRELIALATARPGQLNYAAGGTGTPSHLAMELFNLLAKVKLVQVPYKGNGPASIGLMTGECSAMIGSGPSVLPHYTAGKLRALATTGKKRSILDLPAIAEFLPDYEVVQWYGVLAPAGTPAEIIDRLQREIARTIANPKLAQLLTNLGLQPMSNTPDEFRALIKLETETWRKVIKAAGIKGE